MGKNKKKSGPKLNVFKVAGAKSLKKTKAKAVNLGLKNIQQKVKDLDKQFIESKKKASTSNTSKKNKVHLPEKKKKNKVTKEEVEKTSGQVEKIDL